MKRTMTVMSAILKHWTLKALPLSLLLIASLFSRHLALVSAIIFTLFVPGYIIVEYYFKDLNIQEKILLYLLLSVLISTQLIYCLSLAFGYSGHTILIAFAVLLASLILIPIPILILKHHTKREPQNLHLRSLKGVLISAVIALFAFFVLSQSVWVWYQNRIILTGSNWQDTPMHYAIIESINNGNFPPQMPYYAGVEMRYHYLVDFHTAILEEAFGAFLPRLIVFTNAFFVFLFALSLYVLASYLKNERAGVYTVLLGTLGAGFSYFLFFHALFSGRVELTTNYAYEYGKFFTVPPIFDNLLQQRPQLMGLPTLTTALYFFYRGSSRSHAGKREIALAGLLTGLLFPFHMLACFSALLLCSLLLLKKFLCTRLESTSTNFYELYFFVFSLPLILPHQIPMFVGNGPGDSLIGLNLPWAFYFVKGRPLLFYLANLGLPFLLAIAGFFKKSVHPHSFFVYSWLFLMLALPNSISFTPNVWDMYKFFHYAWVAIAIAAGGFLADISLTGIIRSPRRRKVLVTAAITLLLVFSIFTSALVATWNLSTRYSCADACEYATGLWVRENIPERAVFLTWYSIHTPVTMIGGRLRVLGYVNWAYGHGFDMWGRMADVERAYRGNISETRDVMRKYDANYVYVGEEELKNAPGCLNKFEHCKQLELVYEDLSGKNYIFKSRTQTNATDASTHFNNTSHLHTKCTRKVYNRLKQPVISI
ncbi:MAG: hypothetical protein WAV32_00585 [Halobacteriota archaeon]